MSHAGAERAAPARFAERRKVQFVVKTSKFCNLRCRYCYEFPHLADRAAMSVGQLNRMYRSIADHYYAMDAPISVEFVWHGGEPLLIDPKFYWETFDDQTRIFEDPRITVSNVVQTNLTVLNDDLIALLAEGFDGIGISIDLFSGLRVNAAGRDLQPTILKNMDRLTDAGIRFGCITVLSRQNRPDLRRIFRFYSEAEIMVRILPVHYTATDGQTDADCLTEDEVLRAYCELFDLWIESPASFVIEPIHSYFTKTLRALAGGENAYYDKAKWEQLYIVDIDGHVYSYADAYDRPLAHGNLFHEPLRIIVDGERHQRAVAAAEARLAAICPDCRHYGRACTGYPIAEESPQRRDPSSPGKGVVCIRERGTLDHIEGRLRTLGIVDARGRLDASSRYFPRIQTLLDAAP